MEGATRIPIQVVNGQGYVWGADDAATLRSEHHICGLLTGSLPQIPQQNVFLGLPLQLMPEEVVLLVEKGICSLVDDPKAHRSPTGTETAAFHSERREDIAAQHAEAMKAVAESRRKWESVENDEVRRKREERERRRKERRKAAGNEEDGLLFAGANDRVKEEQQGGVGPESSANLPTPESLQSSSLRSDERPIADFTKSLPLGTAQQLSYSVVVQGPSSSLPWYESSTHAYHTIAAAREGGIWTYPNTVDERARCGVFKDLWERGFFMGNGLRFGGHYLVYPGDPLRYHSHFTATVFSTLTACIPPLDIVALGRLGTATKKAHLLCGWDDEKRETTYFSISWAGFGT